MATGASNLAATSCYRLFLLATLLFRIFSFIEASLQFAYHDESIACYRFLSSVEIGMFCITIREAWDFILSNCSWLWASVCCMATRASTYSAPDEPDKITTVLSETYAFGILSQSFEVLVSVFLLFEAYVRFVYHDVAIASSRFVYVCSSL